jgi:FixJ family two-component response regulator
MSSETRQGNQEQQLDLVRATRAVEHELSEREKPALAMVLDEWPAAKMANVLGCSPRQAQRIRSRVQSLLTAKLS